MSDDRDQRDALITAVALAIELKQFDRARAYVSDWLARYPDDEVVKKLGDEIDEDESF